MLSGTAMLVRSKQLLNAQSAMLVMLLGSVTVVRLWYEPKALVPMLVMLLGKVRLVRPQQVLNTPLPMPVSLLGRVILVRLLQEANAQSPTLVTLSGIVRLVSPVSGKKVSGALSRRRYEHIALAARVTQCF